MVGVASSNRKPASGEPWTVRVAVWSARHRWPVLGLWFVFTIGLLVASLAMGGQRSQSVMGDAPPIGESGEAWKLFNDAGKQATTESFWLVVSSPAGPVDSAAGQAGVAGIVKSLGALTATVDGKQVPVFEDLVDPFRAEALARANNRTSPGLVSVDHTAALITAKIAGEDAEALAKVKALKPLLASLKTQHPELTQMALENRIINDDFGEYINRSLDSLLWFTLPLTFLILLVAFRAVVAAAVPLVLAVSSVVGAVGLVGIYSQVVTPVSQYAMQIVVLIGLAVAIDYSLFVVTRFRTERNAGRAKLFAIEIASATAGRAVFFSGLAVMISLAGLLLINEPVFQSIAVGAISVVLISVVGSLTFLPAVIAVLDRALNWPRLPFLNRGEGNGIWAWIVRGATAHPIVVCLAVAAVLLLAAVPVTRLQLGSTTNDVSTLPNSIEGIRAWKTIDQKWPGGQLLTLDVVVTNGKDVDTFLAIDRMTTDGLTVAGVAGPVTLTPSGDRTVYDIGFKLRGTANDRSNWQIVQRFRTETVPAIFGQLPNTRALVTGNAAYSLDYGDWYGKPLPLVMGFVLGMSFLLLLVAFHSIVIPIKAILLNLLSAGASFGVLVLVFQEGFLGNLTGVKPGVIEAWAPVMIFTILFGLSMDYHVFILTRVKEAKDRGLSSNDAVVKGITITSGTVTSAAAIMVCVFGAFFTIQITVMQELGLGLAVAVLIDATLVRSLLLPASMRLLGDWNWWLPPFLRWIPRITIEGEPEEPLGDGSPAGDGAPGLEPLPGLPAAG